MTEIFISYSRRDLVAAQELRAWLGSNDIHTWMDTDLPGGAKFADEIELRIARCSAVLVLWTPSSIHSQWVKEEAHKALELGKLIPLKSTNLSTSSLPLGFSRLNTLDVEDAPRILSAISDLTGCQLSKGAGAAARVLTSPIEADFGISSSARTRQSEHWKLIKGSTQRADFVEFLNKYPFGALADEARSRVKSLGSL